MKKEFLLPSLFAPDYKRKNEITFCSPGRENSRSDLLSPTHFPIHSYVFIREFT